jgi:DnaJ-class molecular chaperone
MSIDPWKVLGIKPGSSKDEIKKAYKDLAMKYHPDVNHAPGANERMSQINVAFAELMKEPVQGFPQGFKTQSSGAFTYGGYATVEDLINDMLFNAGSDGKRHVRAFRVEFRGVPRNPGDPFNKAQFQGIFDAITKNDFNPAKPVQASYILTLTPEEANSGKTIVIKRKRRISVIIPPNVRNGQLIYLRNALQVTDGIPGDINLTVKIE